MKTTLNKIRDKKPCKEGWEKLLTHLKKTKADDEELSLLTVLKSNGVEDAIWCLRAVDDCDRDARLFAVWCARQVQHLITDQRSIDTIDAAERFADGLMARNDLNAARAAARGAAWDAAWAAAWGTARGAAWDAAWAAARGAARGAAWGAARGAAWDAALNAQKEMFTSMCNGNAPWQTHN